MAHKAASTMPISSDPNAVFTSSANSMRKAEVEGSLLLYGSGTLAALGAADELAVTLTVAKPPEEGIALIIVPLARAVLAMVEIVPVTMASVIRYVAGELGTKVANDGTTRDVQRGEDRRGSERSASLIDLAVSYTRE